VAQDFETLGVQITQKGAEKTAQDIRKTTTEVERFSRTAKTATGATNTHATSLGKAGTAATAATVATEKHNQALTRSSGRLKVIGRDINRYFIIPMTAFIALSARASFTLNDGMANVQALIPGTGDRIYELRDSVRDLGAQTGKTFNDITSGLYRTISVFQDNADTVDRLNTAIRVGIAGYATTAESVQLLSSVTRSYGDTSAEAVEKVADLAFEAVRLGDTTIPALAGAMQVATDRAVRLGVSQEELFATMATLTGVTGDASMVATQFRSAMDSLLNPTAELTELLQRMGYASAEVAIQEESMVGLLAAIDRDAKATGRSLRDYITRKEGVTLVSRLANEQLGDFAFRLGEIEQSAGAADEAFRGVAGGIGKYNTEIRKARERINGFLSVVGDNLLPTLSEIFKSVGDVAEAFSMLPDKMQRSTIGLVGFATALSILVQVIGALRGLKVVALFGGIGQAVASLSTSAAILTKLVAGLSVVGVAVAAVAALIGVTYVRAQRKAEEAAQMHQDRIETLTSRLDNLRESASMTSGALQALILSRQQAFELENAVPTFRSRPEGGLVETGRMFIEPLSEEEVNRQLTQYKGMLETLEIGYLEELRAHEERLTGEVTPKMAGFTRLLNIAGGEEGQEYERYLKRLFPSDSEARELLRGNISENFDEIASLIIEKRDELQSQMDSGVIGAPQAQALYELTPLADTLEGIVGDNLQMETIKRNIREQEDIAANVEATIRMLEGLSFDAGSLASGDLGPDWREIFEQVTDVNVEGMSGISAASAYNDFIESLNQATRDMAEALGGQADEIQLKSDEIDKRLSDLNGLLIDNRQTFDAAVDYLFGGDGARGTGTNSEYIDMLEGMQGAINDFTDIGSSQFESLETRVNTLFAAIQAGHVPLESLQNELVSFENLLKDMKGKYGLIESMGLLEQFPEFVALFDALKSRIAELERMLSELNVDFSGGEGDVEGAGSKWSFLSDGIMDMMIGLGMAEDTAIEFLNVMRDISAEMAGIVGEEWIDAFEGIGAAMYNNTNMAQAAMNSLYDIVDSIINLLPQALMMAGIKALIDPLVPWQVGLALLAASGLAAVGAGVWNAHIAGTEKSLHRDITERQQPIDQRANGGSVSSSIPYLVGERGPELFVPEVSGNIVSNSQMAAASGRGGGGGEVNIQIVNNAPGVVVEREEKRNNSGGTDVMLMIKAATRAAIAQGEMDGVLGARYGVRKVGVSRS